MECHGTCTYGEQSTGCHVECISFVPSEHLRSLLKATSYQYEPDSAQDNKRGHWLRSTWSSLVAEKLRIPLELCSRIIFPSLIREFTVLYAFASLDSSRSSGSEVTVSDDIWARHTFYEGVRYIASLTNQRPSEDQADTTLISKSKSVSTIFIAEDHLGIRDIWFVSTGSTPRRDYANVWWRKLEITSLSLPLKTHTDVSFAHTSIYRS